MGWKPVTVDYQGRNNGGMLEKWRRLSVSPETAAMIPNLIWTDIAANMLVGTKSLLSAFPDTKSYQVRMNKRRIFFHYAWAIPAIICAGIWILYAILSLILCLIPLSRSQMRFSSLTDLVNQLSVGRTLVIANQLDNVHVKGSTKHWIDTVGRTRVDLFSLKNTAEDGMEMGSLSSNSENITALGFSTNQKKPFASTKFRRASF
jgi:hypothetical protein